MVMMRRGARLKSGIVVNSTNCTPITRSVAGIGVGKGSLVTWASATVSITHTSVVASKAFRFIGLLSERFSSFNQIPGALRRRLRVSLARTGFSGYRREDTE